MKRSTFLSILSLIPFFRKKKSIAEQFNVPKARLQDYEQVTFKNVEERMKEYQKIWFNTKFEIKGEDLFIVLDKNNRKG